MKLHETIYILVLRKYVKLYKIMSAGLGTNLRKRTKFKTEWRGTFSPRLKAGTKCKEERSRMKLYLWKTVVHVMFAFQENFTESLNPPNGDKVIDVEIAPPRNTCTTWLKCHRSSIINVTVLSVFTAYFAWATEYYFRNTGTPLFPIKPNTDAALPNLYLGSKCPKFKTIKTLIL